jgi:hypothetical protein
VGRKAAFPWLGWAFLLRGGMEAEPLRES